MTDPVEPFRIVTVCTHNRTRSVMMAALIDSMLDASLGSDAVVVASAGFGPPDIPAIAEAVAAMRRRGLDVGTHRSRRLDGDIVRSADLLLTAERDHVIGIASIDPVAFARSMTLPEFIAAASRVPATRGDAATAWLRTLTEPRTAIVYLHDEVVEVDDPTGLSGRAFEAAVVALEVQCAIAATLLARALRPPR